MNGAPMKDRPRAFIIGSPPMFRGTTKPGRDVEMQILKHFPGVPMFVGMFLSYGVKALMLNALVEKPIATGPSDEIEEAFKVAKAVGDSKTLCSVG